MKALTLIQPWAWAIVELGKRVENRTWAPPRSLIGQHIAIHAGKKFDKDDFDWLLEEFGSAPTDPVLGAVVATARISRVVTSKGQLQENQCPWFFGPVGWVLEDVCSTAEIPCRGAQGLWDLPPDIEQQVLRSVVPLAGRAGILSAAVLI